jgi:hypothetical protein
MPLPTDAGLILIGRIQTPWQSRMVTPRQGRPDGPLCRIELFELRQDALLGVQEFARPMERAIRN